MPAKKYPDEQRADVLELYREHGLAETVKRTSIPRRTIISWAERAGVRTDAPSRQKERTRHARRAAAEAWAQRRARLADKAGQLAETFVDDAFDTTDPRDRKLLVEAAEKAGGMAQLLTGGATSRTEHDVTEPGRRLALVQELKTKPAGGEQAAG